MWLNTATLFVVAIMTIGFLSGGAIGMVLAPDADEFPGQADVSRCATSGALFGACISGLFALWLLT